MCYSVWTVVRSCYGLLGSCPVAAIVCSNDRGFIASSGRCELCVRQLPLQRTLLADRANRVVASPRFALLAFYDIALHPRARILDNTAR
jgi:hypothetical protein